jgi:hypothetical protein
MVVGKPLPRLVEVEPLDPVDLLVWREFPSARLHQPAAHPLGPALRLVRVRGPLAPSRHSSPVSSPTSLLLPPRPDARRSRHERLSRASRTVPPSRAREVRRAPPHTGRAYPACAHDEKVVFREPPRPSPYWLADEEHTRSSVRLRRTDRPARERPRSAPRAGRDRPRRRRSRVAAG